jgi:hypothetical protein
LTDRFKVSLLLEDQSPRATVVEAVDLHVSTLQSGRHYFFTLQTNVAQISDWSLWSGDAAFRRRYGLRNLNIGCN